MKSEDVVSIIVPIYNVEKYLHRCVESIISQTYEKIEIILVDDGSPDESGKICDEYAKKDNRIKVIHKTNGGISSARNAGIKASTGDYIVYVDSDDWLEKNAIEILHTTIINENVDTVIGNYFISDGESFNKPIEYSKKIANKKFIKGTEEFDENVMLPIISGQRACYIWLFITKKSFLSGGKNFNEEVSFVEDGLYTLELLKKLDSIYFLDMPLYHYFTNQNGLTRSSNRILKNIKQMPLLMKFFDEILSDESFSKNNYKEIRRSANSKIVMSYLYSLYKEYSNNEKFINEVDEIFKNQELFNMIEKSNLLLLDKGLKMRVENFFLKLVKKKKLKTLVFFYGIRNKLRF